MAVAYFDSGLGHWLQVMHSGGLANDPNGETGGAKHPRPFARRKSKPDEIMKR